MNISATDLQTWMERVLLACNAAPEAARTTAGILTRTSLRGIDTHGVSRLPAYAKNLQTGEFNPQANVTFSDQHGTLVCEGDAGLGQYVGALAVRAAMDRVQSQAIVNCVIRNCGHLAALGVILAEAAERGFVAMLCQQTTALIAMPGFKARAIGNNPLAFVMPVKGKVPLVFDMAMSVAARGKLADAAREGRTTMPEGWALDESGEPTTDVKAGLRGSMLAVGGHKGIGMAMLVQCFAASLAGSATSPAGMGPSGGGTSAFLMVANPALLAGQQVFDDSVAGWMKTYLDAAGEGGRYPGEGQAAHERERAAKGIPVEGQLLAELIALGASLNVPFPDAPGNP